MYILSMYCIYVRKYVSATGTVYGHIRTSQSTVHRLTSPSTSHCSMIPITLPGTIEQFYIVVVCNKYIVTYVRISTILLRKYL